MKKSKYIIFDCDGVLVDSEIINNRVEAEFKTELGFPTTVEEQIAKFVGLGLNSTVLQEELRTLPKDYLEQVDLRIKSAYLKELRSISGIPAVLNLISLPKCVASSSQPAWLEFKLSHTQLNHYFPNAIFSGSMVKRGKPAPDLFLYAAEKMGWQIEDCLVVEDSEAGVTAGRAAGMVVCGFVGGSHIFPGHAERLIKAGADYIISDIMNLQRLATI